MTEKCNLETDCFKIDFSPQCGGSITKFQYHNGDGFVDILRPSKLVGFDGSDPLSSSGFVMLPYTGRITNGTFDFDGQGYNLPANMPPESHAIHGCAWQKPIEKFEQAENKIKLFYSFDDETSYPFCFEACQEWTVGDDGHSIEINLSIKNMGKTALPFGMGIHPYFIKTEACKITTDLDAVMLYDDKMVPEQISEIPPHLTFSDGVSISQNAMDNCYIGWGKQASIEWPELKTRLNLTASDVFKNLVIYAPENEQFFCLEPVSNISNAYNNELGLSDTGLVVLKPQEILKGKINLQFQKVI